MAETFAYDETEIERKPRPKQAEVDTDLLLRLLKEEEDDATSYYSSEMARAQSEAMDRYHAKPYGDGSEVPNRSQVVTHDIEDTTNWIMPHLLRVFSGEDVISCEDDGTDDDDSVDTAGKYLHHVFYKDNEGETILHDFLFDGIVQRLGVVRAYWEDPQPAPPKELKGLPLDIVEKYLADPRYEILEAELDDETPDAQFTAPMQQQVMPGMPGGPGLMAGMPQQMMAPQQDPLQFVTVSLKVQRKDRTGRAKVCAVPPEEFRVSRRARCLDTADYHAWKHEEFLANIIADHPDSAYELDPDSSGDTSSEDEMDSETDERVVARFPDEPSTTARNHRKDYQRRKVWLNVEYIRGDFDDDGVIELRRVKRVGNVILENDIVEESEFVAWSPIRVSHRLIGRSLADTLIDIQKIRTVLTRKAMDSLTQALAPRTFVNSRATASDATILDRILDHEVGDVIPVDGNPNEVMMVQVTPDVSASAFQAIEYWDRRSEEASGVNRHAMGIQPQAITQTKGGIDMLQAAANSRVEQVARWAAYGFEKILGKLLRLIVENQDQPRIIKVAGRPMKADPRLWSDDMTVTVHVGMAAESREKKLGYLSWIAGKQEAIMAQGGLDNPIATPKHYRNTLAQSLSVMGFKSADRFFGEIPDGWAPPQPGEDPRTAEVKQKGELAAAELQGKQQLAQAEMQSKQQAQAADIQGKQEIAKIELQFKQQMTAIEAEAKARDTERQAVLQRELATMKMDMERDIAQQRLAQERELALMRMEQEKEMAAFRVAMGAASQNDNAATFRDGGRLDA